MRIICEDKKSSNARSGRTCYPLVILWDRFVGRGSPKYFILRWRWKFDLLIFYHIWQLCWSPWKKPCSPQGAGKRSVLDHQDGGGVRQPDAESHRQGGRGLCALRPGSSFGFVVVFVKCTTKQIQLQRNTPKIFQGLGLVPAARRKTSRDLISGSTSSSQVLYVLLWWCW